MLISGQSRVTLHFAIKLCDGGALVDSNFGKNPASFAMGDGSLLPGFEHKLLGLAAGDAASFIMPPQEAFGERKDENLQTFARSQLSAYALKPGLMISFADAARAELPGVVVEFNEQSVLIDFNHPLAGRVLQFDVAIVNVEPIPQRASV